MRMTGRRAAWVVSTCVAGTLLCVASPAGAQSYLCDRSTGWQAVTGGDCQLGRCSQQAEGGTKWGDDPLLSPAYRLIVGKDRIVVQGIGKAVVPAAAPSQTLQIVRRDKKRIVALQTSANGGQLVEFFFDSLTLHWMNSYYLVQEQPPARLEAVVATCRPQSN